MNILLITLIIINAFISDAKRNYKTPYEWEFSGFHNDNIHNVINDNLKNKIFQSDDHIQNAIKESRADVERWRIELGIPGVVAGVSVNGKEVWSEGFGYTDIENAVKAQRESVWRLASISKSLTSTLVGTLMDEGLIHLDDKISSQLPLELFTPKLWKGRDYRNKITLKQVMSHTAGLHVSAEKDYIMKPIFIAENVTQEIKNEAVLYKNEPLLFEPGKGWNYSNYGFQIVGGFAEQILLSKKKLTYEHTINAMFAKLGMTSTMAERRGRIVPNRARHYKRDEQTNFLLENCDILDEMVNVWGYWPAGGIISTVPDLLIMGNELLRSYKGIEGSFLKKQTLMQLWTPVSGPLPNRNAEYAMGWAVTNFTELNNPQWKPLKWSVWHNGGMSGTSTQFAIFPEFDMIVAIFANEGGVEGLSELVFNIAKHFAIIS